RAIDSPPCLRLRVISWSESGFWRFSWATRSWIIFLTLIDETISPRPVAIPLWKKNFSSKRPWGVWTYLLVVTRLTVDSCIPMSSATSRKESGCSWGSPWSRNSFWNVTIDLVTRYRVRCRCCTLLISQIADRRRSSTYRRGEQRGGIYGLGPRVRARACRRLANAPRRSPRMMPHLARARKPPPRPRWNFWDIERRKAAGLI